MFDDRYTLLLEAAQTLRDLAGRAPDIADELRREYSRQNAGWRHCRLPLCKRRRACLGERPVCPDRPDAPDLSLRDPFRRDKNPAYDHHHIAARRTFGCTGRRG